MTATETKAEFKPTCVLIPADALPPAGDNDSVVIPTECTLLHLDSTSNSGWLYTREEWEAGTEPRIYRTGFSREPYEGLAEGETVELLPDMAIVKLQERQYWEADTWIMARVTAIYAVYAIDLRQHVHICSVTPAYEAYYLETQYDEVDGLSDEEHEQLWEKIREVGNGNEKYSYFDVPMIDRAMQNVCREGDTPANQKSGGYRMDTGMVRTEDAYRYCEEKTATSSV